MPRPPYFLLPIAALATAPSLAGDLRPGEPSVLYYVSVPLGGGSRAERKPVLGFALQGNRPYEALRVDSNLMRLVGGGVEVKWLLVGGAAAGVAVLASGRDRTAEAQRAQQALQPAPCASQPAC